MSWLALGGSDDERRDADMVAQLEHLAEAAERASPVEAMRLLAEADELRARWDEPRERFASLAEALEELEVAADRDAER